MAWIDWVIVSLSLMLTLFAWYYSRSELQSRIKKALTHGKVSNSLRVARDGVEALEMLRREGQIVDAKRSDVILLTRSEPATNGRSAVLGKSQG